LQQVVAKFKIGGTEAGRRVENRRALQHDAAADYGADYPMLQ